MQGSECRDTAQSVFQEREENSTEKKENLNKIYFSNVRAERRWAAMPGPGGLPVPVFLHRGGRLCF